MLTLMKKSIGKYILALTVFLFFTFTVNGQVRRGAISFNFNGFGNYSFASYMQYDQFNGRFVPVYYERWKLSAFPRLGYCILPNFLSGLKLNYQIAEEKRVVNGISDPLRNDFLDINLGPYLRYHLFYKKASFIIESSYLFSMRLYDLFGNPAFGIAPGFSYFVNDHLSIELLINRYFYTRRASSVPGLSHNIKKKVIVFELGINVFIRNKK